MGSPHSSGRWGWVGRFRGGHAGRLLDVTASSCPKVPVRDPVRGRNHAHPSLPRTCSAVTFRSNRSRSIRAQTDPPGACAVRHQSAPRWPAQAPPRRLHGNLLAPALGLGANWHLSPTPTPRAAQGSPAPRAGPPKPEVCCKGAFPRELGPGRPCRVKARVGEGGHRAAFFLYGLIPSNAPLPHSTWGGRGTPNRVRKKSQFEGNEKGRSEPGSDTYTADGSSGSAFSARCSFCLCLSRIVMLWTRVLAALFSQPAQAQFPQLRKRAGARDSGVLRGLGLQSSPVLLARCLTPFAFALDHAGACTRTTSDRTRCGDNLSQ